MRYLSLAAIFPALILAAIVQQSPSAAIDEMSLEQQIKVGEILTKDAGAPWRGGAFSLARDAVVPAGIELRAVPAGADAVATQLKGLSYLVVDEEIAIVDLQSRKIVAVLPRWKSQDEGASAPSR